MDDVRWLAEAWREFGQRERPGPRDNTRILALFRDAGHAEVTRDEVAWCAAFCGACLERAGLRSTRSLMARSYLKWGAALAKPRMGAIAVFSRGPNPALGHVGFWLGEAGDDVVLLGGNQANAVSVARYPKSRLLALRWPGPEAELAPAKPAGIDVFARALAHVLAMEGGLTDDPHDPGGPTNRGITLGVFASWRGVPLTAATRAGLMRDLEAIDDETVSEIYRRRYWERARCAELTATLALMHFDAAVNHGVGTAIRMLQESVAVTVDGEIGPETRAAIVRKPAAETIAAYAAVRRRRYRALPHFWRFGRGWLKRVEATVARARELDGSRISPQDPEGETDMTQTPTATTGKWWGHSLTIWGTLVTILSTVVPALAPVTGVDVPGGLVEDAGRGVVEAVQSVGALIGTLMTIYGRFRATGPLQRSLLNGKG
jgi:uncharacterized protein (TIGR02594 family)